MSKAIMTKFPVDNEKFSQIICSKFETKKNAANMIGRSDSFFQGQILKGGFDKPTVLLIENVLGIPYSEYELSIESENSEEDDVPQNEIVAYAREITRLSNLYRSIYEMVSWLEYRESITNDAILKLLENLGVDTTIFMDRLCNDAYYPNRKENME